MNLAEMILSRYNKKNNLLYLGWIKKTNIRANDVLRTLVILEKECKVRKTYTYKNVEYDTINDILEEIHDLKEVYINFYRRNENE
jgi:hypothetical protein